MVDEGKTFKVHVVVTVLIYPLNNSESIKAMVLMNKGLLLTVLAVSIACNVYPSQRSKRKDSG